MIINPANILKQMSRFHTIERTYRSLLFIGLCMLLAVININAQIPDPDLGLRAAWMRGTWGMQWNAKGIENGKSETYHEDFALFLDQVKGFKSMDYIDVYLNPGGYYSCVHSSPHNVLESLWEGDMSGGEPINLIVPRASAGVDPLLEILQAIKAEGLKTQVYGNCFNFMRANPTPIPDVSERWFAYCDENYQEFINSQSYHTDASYPNRKYYFCYAEFILKEYAIRFGDLVDSWIFDAAHSLSGYGEDAHSGELEDQRIFQAYADACHAGNPNAAVAFNNGPNRETEETTPFTSATLFDDFMFGHPYNAGREIGSHILGDPPLYDRNYAMIQKMVETDGYVWSTHNDSTWDDYVVGHVIFPMSTINWSTGDTPALTDEEFKLWNLKVIQGNGAITWGVSLISPYGSGTNRMVQDWAMDQLTLMDAHLLEEQYAGAPAWARQETYLPPAYIGQAWSRDLVEGVDFWDPEGDEITDVLIVAEDTSPSWLSISETTPGIWTLSGIPDETMYTVYEFRLQVKDASGETDRWVKMNVIDPDSIPVTGVMVSPSRASLFIEGTQPLTAIVYPSDAHEKSVSWSSSDTTIATLDSSGLVTARDTGRVTITATTLDGAYTDECVVVVTSIPVDSVVITPDSVLLTTIGETQSLSATVYPSNATNKSISWNSNDTSIAAVDSIGLVTAIATGVATITATTLDGSYTDECIVSLIIEDPTTTRAFVNEKFAKDLMLYPNPVNNTLNFDFRNIKGANSIAIYSLLGKQMFTHSIESSTGYIDISKLHSGVYFLKIRGNKTVVTRFVKK